MQCTGWTRKMSPTIFFVVECSLTCNHIIKVLISQFLPGSALSRTLSAPLQLHPHISWPPAWPPAPASPASWSRCRCHLLVIRQLLPQLSHNHLSVLTPSTLLLLLLLLLILEIIMLFIFILFYVCDHHNHPNLYWKGIQWSWAKYV